MPKAILHVLQIRSELMVAVEASAVRRALTVLVEDDDEDDEKDEVEN